jgi:WD40 repeat protein
MRSLNAFLPVLAVLFLAMGLVLGEQRVPANSLWVATPTEFPPVLGKAPITSSNASQVEQLAVLRTGSVTSITFSPDGTLLAFNGAENTADIHRLQTGRSAGILREDMGYASRLAFSPDGTRLAVANLDGIVHLWSITTGKEMAALQGHTGEVSSVAFNPDGMLLASASGIPEFTLRVWDVETGTQVEVLRRADGEEFFDVAFSPDGTLLAAATGSINYGKIRLWDIETWTLVTTFDGYSNLVSSLMFSHDGTFLVTGSYDGTIRRWEVGSGNDPTVLHRYDAVVHSIDLSADDSLLAIALHDTTIRLWNLTSECELVSLEGHTGSVWSIAFSPDSKLLASGSMYPDETVRLWGIP